MGADKDNLKLVGKRIDGYSIKRFIGSGGYSYIYQAELVPEDNSEEKKEDVVLKVLAPKMFEKSSELGRSIHEGKVLSNLNHPSIIGYKDSCFFSNGTIKSHYLVLEYFPYQDLDIHIEKGRSAGWGLEKKAEVVLNVSKALYYLHENDIMHLDVKPGNILCNDKKTKLVDFFLAQYINKSRFNPRQKEGTIYGTINFLPPESLFHKYEPASDIFSLGLVFYGLLRDQADPFKGEDFGDVWGMLQGNTPFSIHKKSWELPAEVGSLVRGMTALDPKNRPDDKEIICELEKILK